MVAVVTVHLLTDGLFTNRFVDQSRVNNNKEEETFNLTSSEACFILKRPGRKWSAFSLTVGEQRQRLPLVRGTVV